MTLRLLDGQAKRCDQRFPALGIREHDQGCIGPLEGAGRLECPGEHFVEVDRARELPEDATPASFLLGALERPCQLPSELVHPGVQGRDDLGDALVGRVVGPPADDEQGQE